VFSSVRNSKPALISRILREDSRTQPKIGTQMGCVGHRPRISGSFCESIGLLRIIVFYCSVDVYEFTLTINAALDMSNNCPQKGLGSESEIIPSGRWRFTKIDTPPTQLIPTRLKLGHLDRMDCDVADLGTSCRGGGSGLLLHNKQGHRHHHGIYRSWWCG